MSKNYVSKMFCLLIISALVVSSNVAVASAISPSVNIHRGSDGLQTSIPSVNHANGTQGSKASLDWSVESLEGYVDSQNTVEVIVGLDNTATNKNQVATFVSQNGGQIIDTISMGDKAAVVVKVSVSAAFGFVDRVRNSGISTYVEPNGESHVTSTPNDPHWNLQWGTQRVKANQTWDTTVGSDDLLVAVIDTGVDYNHPDLMDNYVALGYDFINNDNDPKDDFGHGTHCAGIIAATINNAIGVAGVADVKIMAEKGLGEDGSGPNSVLAQCIVNATDAGADILSNSWGGGSASNVLIDAINYANSKGVLVFFSAGNDNTDQAYPAMLDGVIAVAATNTSDTKASFSNYGSWVDVAAPGVRIYSTTPTYTVTINTKWGYPQDYSYMNGTSMACPMAAGVAALIWSQYPDMTAPFVRAQLEATCDDAGAAGFDNIFGYGIVNAQSGVEQEPVAHDLAAETWVKPSYVMLGVAQSFNLSVLNKGSSAESNVQIGLFVNGTLKDSTVIPSLAAYHSDSRLLTWTPPALGTYNVTYGVVPAARENETYWDNNQLTVFYQVMADPSTDNWTQIASYPDYTYGCNMKAAYSQLQSEVVFFKMDYYNNWASVTQDINTGIMIDIDQNISTGMPQNYYPGQNDTIGSDFMILVGNEGTEMWRWDYDTRSWDTDNPINLLYLDAPNNSATFVVGVSAADLETDGVFDCSFNDIFDYYNPPDSTWYSAWYWMPTKGYVPYIAQPTQRDLIVTLEVPKIWTPQTPCNLTAKVFNFGQTSEIYVNLELYIDGTVVANSNFASIASGAFEKVSILVVPDTGIYNITAYASPKANEVNIDNNVRTRIAPVSPKIAVISDNDELWTTLNVLDTMNVNYDYGNYNYYYNYTSDIGILSQYSVVITYNNARNITALEQLALNGYLAGGGNLLVTGHDALVYPDAKLANVVRAISTGDAMGQDALIVVDATHPIMYNGYGDFTIGYQVTGLASDNDAIQPNTAQGASTIAKLADDNAKIIATDSLLGKVVFWNGEGSNDWMTNNDCQAIFKNTMLWFLDTSAPTTTNDYDGQWHTSDFTINLSAQDYFGVAQTYYKVNDGETKTVSANGQPQITTDATDNTLEYWSKDISGNEETHHTLNTVKLDKTAPSGSVQIEDGNSYTTLTSVTLTLTASDITSGISQVRYSNDGTWDTETWEAFAATKSWTLTTGDGEKTVYYQVQNNAGLTSVFSDTIILDTVPPTGSVTINNADTYTISSNVNLQLTSTDAAQMRFSNNQADWSNWEPYSATADWTLTTNDGTKTVYVQFKDVAGLISTGYSDTIILDTTNPTGSIAINDDADYTNSTTVTLTLAILDINSNPSKMRFSNDNTSWSDWESYATSKQWTLSEGDGNKTVYCQFQDASGLSSSVMTDTIVLDTTPPTPDPGPAARTVTLDTPVQLSAEGSSDANGIASYTWDFDGVIVTGMTTTRTYQGVGVYTVKLTVQDVAGNSADATVTITVKAKPAASPVPTTNPTTNPTATPTPTTTPTPTPTPAPEPLNVTKTDGTTTDQIVISGGNITVSQITNAKIQVDETTQTTTLSFTITGEEGTTGTGTITIPKSQVPSGLTPTIYIDNQPVDTQSFTEDAENYYVTYTTHFSTHEVKIVFEATEPPSPSPFDPVLIAAVAVVIVCVGVVAVVLLRRRKAGA